MISALRRTIGTAFFGDFTGNSICRPSAKARQNRRKGHAAHAGIAGAGRQTVAPSSISD